MGQNDQLRAALERPAASAGPPDRPLCQTKPLENVKNECWRIKKSIPEPLILIFIN